MQQIRKPNPHVQKKPTRPFLRISISKTEPSSLFLSISNNVIIKKSQMKKPLRRSGRLSFVFGRAKKTHGKVIDIDDDEENESENALPKQLLIEKEPSSGTKCITCTEASVQNPNDVGDEIGEDDEGQSTDDFVNPPLPLSKKRIRQEDGTKTDKKTKSVSKVDIKNAPCISSRQSPHQFVNMCKELSKSSKKAIKDLGFEGALKCSIGLIPGRLRYWVVDNFDTKNLEMRICGETFKLTREAVHDALGFPMGKVKVNAVTRAGVRDTLLVQTWRKQYLARKTGAHNITVKHVIDKLLEAKEHGDMFKLNAVVLIMTLMAEGIKCGTVNQKILPCITNVDKIADMDWCSYVIDCAKKCKKKWNENNNKNWFTDPLLPLVLWFSTTMQRIERAEDIPFPAIRYWTSERLKEIEKKALSGNVNTKSARKKLEVRIRGVKRLKERLYDVTKQENVQEISHEMEQPKKRIVSGKLKLVRRPRNEEVVTYEKKTEIRPKLVVENDGTESVYHNELIGGNDEKDNASTPVAPAAGAIILLGQANNASNGHLMNETEGEGKDTETIVEEEKKAFTDSEETDDEKETEDAEEAEDAEEVKDDDYGNDENETTTYNIDEFMAQIRTLYKEVIDKKHELTDVMWRAQFEYPLSNEIHDLLHHVKDNFVEDLNLKEFSNVHINEQLQEIMDEIREDIVNEFTKNYKQHDVDENAEGYENAEITGDEAAKNISEQDFQTPDAKIVEAKSSSRTMTQILESTQCIQMVDAVVEEHIKKSFEKKRDNLNVWYEESPGKRRKLSHNAPSFSLGLTQTQEPVVTEKQKSSAAKMIKEMRKKAAEPIDIIDVLNKLEKNRAELGLHTRLGLGFKDFEPSKNISKGNEGQEQMEKKEKRKMKPTAPLKSPYKNREVNIHISNSPYLLTKKLKRK